MSLRTFVKVGGITNLSDARYCAGMGADLLGFSVIEGQENYISPASFQEIRGWVTGPLVVAEIYGITNPTALKTILENYRPDFLELGVAEFSLVGSIPIPYILSLKKGEAPLGDPEFILTEIESGYSTSAKRLVHVKSGNEAEQILNQSGIHGIALKGSMELKPGLKDYQELAEIFEMLEMDD